MVKFAMISWMKIALVLVLLCAAAFVREARSQQDFNCLDCVQNQVLVELPNQNNLALIAEKYNLLYSPSRKVGTPPTYLMTIDRTKTDQTPEQIVAAMRYDRLIGEASTNTKFALVEKKGLSWTIGNSWAIGSALAYYSGSDFSGSIFQWFPGMIRLNNAHQVTKGTRVDNGRPVVVAVLDTGIDWSHPAFEGKLVAGYDFVDNDDDPSEKGFLGEDSVYGHGTHVAGIVALTAPEAKIMPIRVLDENGEGDLWRVTAAIIWAANNGADVVNISFGYTEQPGLLRDLIEEFDRDITDAGDDKDFPELSGGNKLVFMSGAGNGGKIGDGTLPIYPAGEQIDVQLGVAASTRLDRLAAFSTFRQNEIRAAAPGDQIVSTLPGGLYGVWSGTSMATPIASGIAALVKARNPNLSPRSIVEQITATGVSWDCHLASRNVRLKTRRVDAFCAVMNNRGCGSNRLACRE